MNELAIKSLSLPINSQANSEVLDVIAALLLMEKIPGYQELFQYLTFISDQVFISTVIFHKFYSLSAKIFLLRKLNFISYFDLQ